MKIGEILIEHGALTPEQLNEALEHQKKERGKLLGKVLIDLGYVTEEDIVIALATQFNVPYLPIANFALPEGRDKLIPKELVHKYICVPLDRIGDVLTVVMADPTNEQAIREIETATKCKVQVFVATATEIAAVIRKHFRIDVSSNGASSEGSPRASLHAEAPSGFPAKTNPKP